MQAQPEPQSYWALTHQVCLLATVMTALLHTACNPFVEPKAGPFEPCAHTIDCQAELRCVQGMCVPDANDGGMDGGDEDDPCLAPALDCTGPDIGDQGEDLDEDGWGTCCDCDDQDAQANPFQTEEPYNGKDDDCSPSSRDDDLDRDGANSTITGGDDCDDADPEIGPQAPERCNGVDDNCDGSTDENLSERPCELTAGVCAGTNQICLGVDGWEACDFPPAFEAEEATCDGLDNDCDGDTDEGVAVLLEPEWDAAASDGLDNNCNGLVDETGGVMVPIPERPNTWIDAFEMSVFESPSCQGTRFGESGDDYPAEWPAEALANLELYACSLPGIVPSSHLSWYRARRACEAINKRLCTKIEHEQACTGAQAIDYPYGPGFAPGVCNDPLGGAGQAVGTGTLPNCTAGLGTFDMSGNLGEWIVEWCDQAPGTAAMAGYGFECLLCVNGEDCRVCTPNDPIDEEEIHRRLMCYTRNQYPECFQRERNEAFFGGRCCLDGPDQ